MNGEEWTVMDFGDLGFLGLPTLNNDDDLILDVGMTQSSSLQHEPEPALELDLETLAEFPDVLMMETSFQSNLKQDKTSSEIEASSTRMETIMPQPQLMVSSVSASEPEPQTAEIRSDLSALNIDVSGRALTADLCASNRTSLETEYTDYHDHIVRSLSIEQLKAIVAAYQLARWKNDLQLGCQAWVEKNTAASEPEIRAVKTLLNPTHWKHTWLVVAAASEIVQRLSLTTMPSKRRSAIHDVGRYRSRDN